MKNRNKITTERTELKEDTQGTAQAPQNCRLPGFRFFAVSAFCWLRKFCLKKPALSICLFYNTNFGINPKSEVKHFKKWPDSSAEAA